MVINKGQREEMKDYLVAKLSDSGVRAEPRSKEILSGIKSNYIVINDKEGLLFLVDKTYPKNSLDRIYREVRNYLDNVGAVIFKDGKTFFRSAVGDENETGIQFKRFKKDKGLSLKNYSNDEFHRMISFRPEEEFLRKRKTFVQYYQPESERLEQGIVSYEFKLAVFDYSHIPSEQRFGPGSKESERLRIWAQKNFEDGALVLEKGLLKPID